MKKLTRIIAVFLCFVISFSSISPIAKANFIDIGAYGAETLWNWITGNSSEPLGGWTPVGAMDAFFSVNRPQKYYTGVTDSKVDKNGNVTNYYRGGDTTNTNIIDSYNKTFNTIYNTTNNTTTNKYNANVKLENFLNQYTTNNVTTNNTYSANFKSWYYDNTTNNYNYNEFNKYDTTNNYLYYNQDNSRYYISIDNSTDEYYLIDVQYSPTFVTVNYTYNTTNINNTENVGDVTNVYYYELTDGRNSSTLTADEVGGMVFGYDVVNYELVTDDPNTLSLQHFDGDYSDSSSFNRTFYSQNRSSNYVDSGAFGKAVALPNGSAAGVNIPGLSGYNSVSFDFRVYFNDISSLGIYFGDENIFQEVVTSRTWKGKDYYSDNSSALKHYYIGSWHNHLFLSSVLEVGNSYTLSYLNSLKPTGGYYDNYENKFTPYNCSVCHAKKTDVIPSLDHAWEEKGYEPPTCTKPGSINRTCSRCGFSAVEEVPALGASHTWEETSRTDATETSAGSVTYTCSACGASRSERLPPSGLDFSMSGVLEKITEVLAACLGWLGTVADVVVRNPILLLVIVIGFIGTGVVLFRKALRL